MNMIISVSQTCVSRRRHPLGSYVAFLAIVSLLSIASQGWNLYKYIGEKQGAKDTNTDSFSVLNHSGRNHHKSNHAHRQNVHSKIPSKNQRSLIDNPETTDTNLTKLLTSSSKNPLNPLGKSNVSYGHRNNKNSENTTKVPDGIMRVLLMGSCVGSTATLATAKKILRQHGFNIKESKFENYQKKNNVYYDDAKVKLQQQGNIHPSDAEIIVQALLMENQEAYNNGQIMVIKNTRGDIVQALRDRGAKFAEMIRANVLDTAICMAKNCFEFSQTSLGYVVSESNDGKRSEDLYCSQRWKSQTNVTTVQKIHFNTSHLAKFMGASVFANDDKLRHHTLFVNPSTRLRSAILPGQLQAYEDLFAFEHTTEEPIFQMSVQAWKKFMIGLYPDLKDASIAAALRPLQGTRKSPPPPHDDSIENLDEVLHELRKDKRPLEYFVRSRSDVDNPYCYGTDLRLPMLASPPPRSEKSRFYIHPESNDERNKDMPTTKKEGQQGDGVIRVFLLGDCEGSTFTMQIVGEIFALHNMELMVEKREIYKFFVNPYHEKARLKRMEQSCHIPLNRSELFLESLRLMNDDAQRQGKVVAFKNVDTTINRALHDEGALFTRMYRANTLDKLVCEAKDCFLREKYGGPVLANDGSKTDMCFDRRTISQSKIKASFNVSNVVDLVNERLDDISRLRSLHSEFTPQITNPPTYEELVRFEYNMDEDDFQLSVDAWKVFLNGMIPNLDPNLIAKVLRPLQGSRSHPSTHDKVIYNFEAVRKELTSANPQWDSFVRWSKNTATLHNTTNEEGKDKLKHHSRNNGTIIDPNMLQPLWAIDHLLTVPESDSATHKNSTRLSSRYSSAVICACPKGGSTSFYESLYRNLFDKDYFSPGEIPRVNSLRYVQDTHNEEWNGIFNTTRMNYRDLQSHIQNNDTFSLAIIRDPKARLISAWKSKIACDSKSMKTDLLDRRHILRNIFRAANIQIVIDDDTCLSFSDFLKMLKQAEDAGKVDALDVHVKPQYAHCFRHSRPSEWDYVATISDPLLGDIVSEAFALKDPLAIGHSHASNKSATFLMTQEDEKMLESLTRRDYEVFGNLL